MKCVEIQRNPLQTLFGEGFFRMLCGQNFLLMTQVWGCIFPSLVLGLRAQLPGIGLPAVVYRVTLVPQYLHIYSIRWFLSVSILNPPYPSRSDLL